MKRQEIIDALNADAKEFNSDEKEYVFATAELTAITETTAYYFTGDGFNYPDYLQFHFEEGLNDDEIKSRIIISDKARESGIDEDYLLNILKKAYGDELHDALCTLRYISVFLGEDGFEQVMKIMADREFHDKNGEWSDSDIYYDADGVYDYLTEEFERLDDVVGQEFYSMSTAFIDAGAVYTIAEELIEEGSTNSLEAEYGLGIAGTLIHEVRHVMMDTNMLLSEEKYPVKLGAEEAVEEFARGCLDDMLLDDVLINIPDGFSEIMEGIRNEKGDDYDDL